MPTSSQALVWLKKVTDFSSITSHSSETPASPSIPLPDVVLPRHENTVSSDSSLHLPSEVSCASSRQSSPKRLGGGDRLSRCVPLPPIFISADQQDPDLHCDSKRNAAVSPDSKQRLIIDLRSTETILTARDNESQSSKDISTELDPVRNRDGDRRDETEEEVDTNSYPEQMPHDCTNLWMDSLDEKPIQDQKTRSITSDLRDNGVKVTANKSIDIPYYIDESRHVFVPSYHANNFPITGNSFSTPKAINKVDFKEEEVSFQKFDGNKKQPLLTCVLNLNLCGQSCPVHEDSSSCMGILSYNHQKRSHVWNLVPQKLRAPRTNIRGRLIKSRKSRNSFGLGTGTTSNDQKEKCISSYQLDQKVGTHFRMSAMIASMRVANSGLYEESGTGFALEDCQKNENGDFNEVDENEDFIEVDYADNLSEGSHETPSVVELNTAIQKWEKEQESTGKLEAVPPFPQRRLYDNLKCSGIINNESYFFDEDDNIDGEPHFLETLIAMPKPHDFIEELISSQPRTPSPHTTSQLHDNSYTPSPKEHTSKPAFRTFTGLTPTQKKKAKSITEMKNTLPKVITEAQKDWTLKIQPSKDWTLKIPPVTFKSSEMKDSKVEVEEPHSTDNVALSQPESLTSLSAPIESKVIGMRPELPPLHPNRLCFRTSLSGCSHAEVLAHIESQRNVKVTWLQYEPTSLHYSDVASSDYRHVCMWSFELSPDSDTVSLLLEGFKLRGQRMNILHLDDVYREEYRTFNLCNEIYKEQCSKNLIKNKSKHFLKSARLFNVK